MLKTKIVILLVLLLPVLAHGIDKKKKKIIGPGRWREIERRSPDSVVHSFMDTLFIRFLPKDSFQFRHRNGFVYEGVYTVSEDSIVDLGSVKYKILLKRPDTLLLTNQKGYFLMGVDNSDTAEVIVLQKQDTARPVTDIDMMIGRWTVYRRKADGFGALDPSDNIRSVYVTGPSTDGKQGFVYSGSDADNAPSWYIKELGGGQSLVCDGKRPRTFKVLRCQDGEMILEEEGMKYFLKQPK
ncbi:MAG: hypothetical protein KF744_03445 [Taibaiella sp.]|nr:hypothetical protein [Taibaiella sp.]